VVSRTAKAAAAMIFFMVFPNCYTNSKAIPRGIPAQNRRHEVPGRGEWFDMRDLSEVIEHVDDQDAVIIVSDPPTLQ
jgi:hypothetical protein